MHPWLAGLVGLTSDQLKQRLFERFSFGEIMPSEPIVSLLFNFAPEKIEFGNDRGYLKCARPGMEDCDVVETIYVAEPCAPDEIAERIAFFDDGVRPLMNLCISKLAYFGESMYGESGQFVVFEDAHFLNLDKCAGGKTAFSESRILYVARTGEVLLVNRQGELAWSLKAEMGRVIPIFKTIEPFLIHYSVFCRYSCEPFHAYTSLQFAGINPFSQLKFLGTG